MYAAAAEESGDDLINGRGDAYCGMLNCSYNLGLRRLHAVIPHYPVGSADEIADMIMDFCPGEPGSLRVSQLKIITFGPGLRISSPVMLLSRACMTWVWKSRKTQNWICWWLSNRMRVIRASGRLYRIWQRNWGGEL